MKYASMKTGRVIADPLGVLSRNFTSESGEDKPAEYVSESKALSNEDPSVCPKCRIPMTSALIDMPVKSSSSSGVSTSAASERVYFCKTCRVTHPMRDE